MYFPSARGDTIADSQGTVMGLLFLGFNLTSILFTFAISHITTDTSSMASAEIATRYQICLNHSANWVVFGSYAIACVFVVLFKPDYRRLAYEKDRRENPSPSNPSYGPINDTIPSYGAIDNGETDE